MAAGSLPIGEVKVRFRATLPPAFADPEDNTNVSVWAKAGVGARASSVRAAAPPNRTSVAFASGVFNLVTSLSF